MSLPSNTGLRHSFSSRTNLSISYSSFCWFNFRCSHDRVSFNTQLFIFVFSSLQDDLMNYFLSIVFTFCLFINILLVVCSFLRSIKGLLLAYLVPKSFSSLYHRWELPGNYPVFSVVMVIYHYVERIWKILVTSVFNITCTIVNRYYPDEPVNIHIQSLINIIQENNWVITTK